jgi:uncharacterized protein (DUF488 family)
VAAAPRLLTIGYEGRTPQDLVAALLDHDVGTVVDVRLTPMSRKPGMSRRALAATLEAAGLSYVHIPALGMPREHRDALHKGQPAAVALMRARLCTPEGSAAVEQVIALTGTSRVALLCVEADPAICRRRLVAEEAQHHQPRLRVGNIT